MDCKKCCVVDAEGCYKTFVLVLLPEGAEPQVQGYTLKSGESLVDAKPPIFRTDTNANGLIAPKRDGSAWTEGATAEEIAAWEAEHPGTVLTLAEVQAAKLEEINAACDAAITSGCDVTLSDGTAGHISLTAEDQINLTTAQTAVTGGAEGYPYHLDGQLCKIYPAADILTLARAATAHILYHATYCNHLHVWVSRCAAVSDVEGIAYGCDLPADLAANMEAILATMGDGNE